MRRAALSAFGAAQGWAGVWGDVSLVDFLAHVRHC